MNNIKNTVKNRWHRLKMTMPRFIVVFFRRKFKVKIRKYSQWPYRVVYRNWWWPFYCGCDILIIKQLDGHGTDYMQANESDAIGIMKLLWNPDSYRWELEEDESEVYLNRLGIDIDKGKWEI